MEVQNWNIFLVFLVPNVGIIYVCIYTDTIRNEACDSFVVQGLAVAGTACHIEALCTQYKL